MPIPVLPLVIGGAGAALLFAGASEKKAAPGSAPSGPSATPTTQTTSGDGGGASAPSHADLVNTTAAPSSAGSGSSGEVNTNVRGLNDIINAAGEGLTPPTNASFADTYDPWAPTPGASLDKKKVAGYTEPTTGTTGALGALTDIGLTSGKAAADAFSAWGPAFGAIW